jgi:hypothetical protein
MPYKDPDKAKEASRKSYYKNKDKWKASRNPAAQLRRQAEREHRDLLLSKFACVCCGESDPTVIEWHHVCPEDKLFGIKEGASYSRERWWDEVLKCISVCCNCHTKIHKNKLCLLKPKR